MPEINALQPLRVQPNRNVLQPGQPGTQAIFGLRSTPPVFLVQIPGGPSAMSFIVLPLSNTRRVRAAAVGPRVTLLPTNPALLQPAAVVHARSLGGPVVSPQLRITGIAHTRALGSHTVIPPPVTPPVEPPPVTPTPPQTSPRNLRYVRRRNIPPERN